MMEVGDFLKEEESLPWPGEEVFNPLISCVLH